MQLNLTLVTFFIAVLSFAACQKEEPAAPEEEVVITESDFIGSWTVSDFSSDFTVTGSHSGKPIDNAGRSSISESDLRITLSEDGAWTSSGTYLMTVVTDDEHETSPQEGVGQGTWSYRDGRLLLNGMVNTNGNGYFEEAQACEVADFVRGRQVELLTELDVTESDPDFNITVRTQAEYRIGLLR